MDQGHHSNQGDGQGIVEPLEEINEVAPMEGVTGDATMEEVNGAAAVNVLNGAGVNSAETQQPAALPINGPLPPFLLGVEDLMLMVIGEPLLFG